MLRRTYSKEEKLIYLAEFKESNESLYAFTKERDIPESTFRGWLEEEQELVFGAIDLKELVAFGVNGIKSTSMIFGGKGIKIELKEGFDKNFLKKIMEVFLLD